MSAAFINAPADKVIVICYCINLDTQVVKVYVSVFGDERGKDIAMAGLKSKAKYVRSVLGKRMKLRLTPEIRFIEDESFERGSRVSNNLCSCLYKFSCCDWRPVQLSLRITSKSVIHLIFFIVSQCLHLCHANLGFIV